MWLLIDARTQAQLREAPELAGMRGRVLGPDFAQNVDRFFSHCCRLLVVVADAELGELAWTHALADAKIKTSLRQIVQHGGLGSEAQGMMERQGIHVVAEAHARGPLQ